MRSNGSFNVLQETQGRTGKKLINQREDTMGLTLWERQGLAFHQQCIPLLRLLRKRIILTSTVVNHSACALYQVVQSILESVHA